MQYFWPGQRLPLGILDRVKGVSKAATDFRSVSQAISRSQREEIYNLAGQSSVGLSFEQPAETPESIATGTLNLLEVVCFLGLPARFYNGAPVVGVSDLVGAGFKFHLHQSML